jgi:hypothetical protein
MLNHHLSQKFKLLRRDISHHNNAKHNFDDSKFIILRKSNAEIIKKNNTRFLCSSINDIHLHIKPKELHYTLIA